MMQYDDASDPILPYLIAPTLDSSIGVFTHQNGDYSLIQMAAGVINAAGINLTGGGASLKESYTNTYETPSIRDTTIGGSDEQNKHEAYVLGQARTISSFIQIGSYTTTGATLSLGWAFNWSGTEALCVTHEPVYVLSQLSHYVARTYKLTVVEDNDGILTASVEMDATSEWEPILAETFIYKPTDDGSDQVEMWYPYACGTGQVVDGYGESACRAEIYAYYKVDGTPVRVEYFMGSKDTTTTIDDLYSEANETLCAYNGWYSDEPGVLSGSYQGHLGSQEFGFAVDGAEYTAVRSDSGLYIKKILTRTIEEACTTWSTSSGLNQAFLDQYTEYDWPLNDSNCLYYGEGYSEGCRYGLKGHYFHLEKWLGSGVSCAANGKAAFIIPTHSVETVYVAILGQISPDVNHSIQEGEAFGEMQRQNRTTGVPTTPWVGLFYPDPGHSVATHCYTNDNIGYTYGYGCWPEPPQYTLAEIENTPVYNITLNLHTAFETEELEDIETEDYYSIGGYSQIFFPTLCLETPLFPSLLNVGSVFGNSIRMESIKDRELGSNCAVDAALMLPYGGLWVGRV